jgi:hypothetical protein
MSNLNGGNVRSLMEAYHSIYEQPQEITEEQIWEEVEAWVNALMEEGYDLSEYTWDEMYEAYIEEQGRNRTPQAVIDRNRASLSNALGRLGNTIMTGNPEGTRTPVRQTPNRRGGGTNKPVPSAAAAKATPTSTTAPAPQLRGLSVGPGGFNINGKPVQTTPPKPAVGGGVTAAKPAPAAAKPAPVAAKPVPTATAKPAPVAAKPAPAAVTQPPESRSQASAGDIRGMIGRSQERQAASTAPQLSARAQALKAGGPKLGPRGM